MAEISGKVELKGKAIGHPFRNLRKKLEETELGQRLIKSLESDKEYVLGFIFNTYNEVLLMLRTKPESQAGKLNGIGGHVEKGETPLEAMIRETKEEVSSTEEINWTQKGEFYSRGWKVYCFAAKVDGIEYLWDEPSITPNKGQELHWCDLDGYNSYLFMYNLEWLLPLCLRDGISFSINEETSSK